MPQEKRSARKRQCGDEQKNQQVRDYKAHDLVRDKLKEDWIARGQRPWRKMKELEVSRQCAHLAMKLFFNSCWPCVVDISGGSRTTVALADIESGWNMSSRIIPAGCGTASSRRIA